MGKNVGGTRNRWGEKKRYEKKSVSYCSQGQPCFIYLSIKWVISAQTSAFLSLSISHWVRRVQKTQISSRLEADWSRTEVVATIRTLFPPPSLLFQLPRGLFHSFVELIWLGSLACSLQHLLYGSFCFFTAQSRIPPLHLSLSVPLWMTDSSLLLYCHLGSCESPWQLSICGLARWRPTYDVSYCKKPPCQRF